MNCIIKYLLSFIILIGICCETAYSFNLKDINSSKINIKEVLEEAKQGDAAAQYAIGWFLFSGEHLAMDKPESIKWFHKAAEQNLMDAQVALGTIYFFGCGCVEPNPKEAKRWLKKAVNNGFLEAQGWINEIERQEKIQK